jgi:hypothetical protein
MFDGLKKACKEFWDEAFVSSKPPKTPKSGKWGLETPGRVEKTPSRDTRVAEREEIPKPVSEADYIKMLDDIKKLRDLNEEYSSCPQQFEHLFKQYFLKILEKTDDINELKDVYIDGPHPEGVGEKILDRYQQILPDFLLGHDLEDVEALYKDCPDQARFGETIKHRYRELLDEIKSFETLEDKRNECSEDFEDLFKQCFLKILEKADDIEELKEIYNEDTHPDGVGEQILDRYQELLPDYLSKHDLEEIEAFYEECLDQERFKETIKHRYLELLNKLDSFDELEDRRGSCSDDFNDLFQKPYQRLLYTVKSIEDLQGYFNDCPEGLEDFYMRPYQKLLEKIDSLDDLEELYENCTGNFSQLFPGQYQRLLKKENTLSNLEDRLTNCPDGCDGLITARYGEVLQTVNSIEGLNDRLDSASTTLHGMIYARYQEILPSAMEKIPPDEIDRFCENVRDECRSLAIACREKMLEK